jgi:carbon-monoxide dehydrogenase catalytic subunit
VEKKASRGVCGASVDTIAARNLARMIAAGAAAHSDHGRDVAHTLLLASQNSDYSIKDPVKLRRVAYSLGVELAGKDDLSLAKEVAEKCLAEFGRQEGGAEVGLAGSGNPCGALAKAGDHAPRD